MLKRGLIFLLLGCCAISLVKGQEKGNVEVIKDSLISALQNLRAAEKINPIETSTVSLSPSVVAKPVDRRTMTRTTVRGYRIQIFSGSNRSDAYDTQARFKSMYKDMDTYINYEEPNYRVKVGDYRSRSEATNFMQLLKRQFHNVFIFTENIFVYE